MPKKTNELENVEINEKDKKNVSSKGTKKVEKAKATNAGKAETKKTKKEELTEKEVAKTKKAAKASTKKTAGSKAETKATTAKATKTTTAGTAKATSAKAVKMATAKRSTTRVAKATTTRATKTATRATQVATKKVASEKTSAKKNTVKASSAKSASRRSTTKKVAMPIEYYDLPYRYNQTVVKILSQTPKNLFVYWDISDEDRENFKKSYGENFFQETKPVLIVHNHTLNYSFKVEINDFANSWYLHINDAKCEYSVELGRIAITHSESLKEDYVYIATSNNIETPNNKVLFNPTNANSKVYYRNVKTNANTEKQVSFIKNMNTIYKLYKEVYVGKNTDILQNPSS